jgi:hypothetical protein
MADKIGYLLLFVSLVAVIVAAGILLGILVAGRIDRLTTPKPASPADASRATEAEPAEDHQA